MVTPQWLEVGSLSERNGRINTPAIADYIRIIVELNIYPAESDIECWLWVCVMSTMHIEDAADTASTFSITKLNVNLLILMFSSPRFTLRRPGLTRDTTSMLLRASHNLFSYSWSYPSPGDQSKRVHSSGMCSFGVKRLALWRIIPLTVSFSSSHM